MNNHKEILKEAFNAGVINESDRHSGLEPVSFDEWYLNKVNKDCPNCNAGWFNGKHCYDCGTHFNDGIV